MREYYSLHFYHITFCIIAFCQIVISCAMILFCSFLISDFLYELVVIPCYRKSGSAGMEKLVEAHTKFVPIASFELEI